MSSAPEKQSPKSDRPKSPERFNLKLLLIWLGIISVIGLLLAVSPAPRSQIQQKKIGQVMRDIEAGKVKNLSITPDPTSGSDKMYVLRGELVTENTGTEPKDPKDAKAPEPIKFESAGILTESSIEKIQQKIPDTVTYPKDNTN